MFKGSIDAGQYTYTAYDKTEEAVVELLAQAWEQHQTNTGAWLEFDQVRSEIIHIEAGKVYES